MADQEREWLGRMERALTTARQWEGWAQDLHLPQPRSALFTTTVCPTPYPIRISAYTAYRPPSTTSISLLTPCREGRPRGRTPITHQPAQLPMLPLGRFRYLVLPIAACAPTKALSQPMNGRVVREDAAVVESDEFERIRAEICASGPASDGDNLLGMEIDCCAFFGDPSYADDSPGLWQDMEVRRSEGAEWLISGRATGKQGGRAGDRCRTFHDLGSTPPIPLPIGERGEHDSGRGYPPSSRADRSG